MNGAESLVHTLLASGIDTCFANPGTSEMHFVAALDKVSGMRCVLGLAETVVTGCADGYARMKGTPAATLMHCGPGFANGIANVHNARRANAPMVNIVGDHATYHRQYDTPLTADVEGLARAVSHWVRTTQSSARVGADGAAAVQAALTPPGQIATLVLPADTAWNAGGEVGARLPVPPRTPVAPETLRSIAQVLRNGGRDALLVMSGPALSEAGLAAAWRIAHVTGAQLRAPTQLPRIARGRGRPPVDRTPYVVDNALKAFAGVRHVILVGAKQPAAFFAYPNKPSVLTPPEAATYVLARPEQDMVTALEWLADELGAPRQVPLPSMETPQPARGAFDPVAFAHTLGALLPENCIVAEDAVTSGRALLAPTFGAAPHDWIQITGGAIGHGFPAATGAAIACPERKVVCLQADGAGMYTMQALWTQARERLDVINVVFANRVYKILHGELINVGAQPGPASNELFDLSRPDIDWVGLAHSLGVEGRRVENLEGFADVFRAACGRRGPFLIEFRIA